MRIVMVTLDVQIDRRILQEAETLIDDGHEVILLAGAGEDLPRFATIGRVKVERLDPARSGPAPRKLPRSTGPYLAGAAARLWTRCCRRAARNLPRPAATGWNWVAHTAARGIRWISRQVCRLWSDPLQCWEQEFVRRIEFYRPDAVHVHDLPLVRVGAASKRALGIPVLLDAHELYSAQPRLTRARRARSLKLEARYLPRLDRIITVNPFLAREIEARHPVGEVAVVQNSIDAPPELGTDRQDLFRRDYGWSDARILVLYHGWIAEERNLEIALRGMKAVRDPRYLLIFMGYGDYADDLRRAAQREGLLDRVAFVPAKPQHALMPYVASADIGLVPYPYGRDLNTHFASPNKLYEFIVAGVPILTNELPFVREIVTQRKIGVCADLQSERGFASALDAFPLERLAEFKQNLLRCQAEFTWKTESAKIKQLYREVTSGSSR